jgi:signal transduction histidine kinase
LYYLSLLFIAFTLMVVYKNPKSRTSWFICLVILGWFCSPYGFVLYLDKNNIYSLFINRYFNLPYSWWNQIALMNVAQVNLIRVMNFGILLFVYAFACYAIAFTCAGHDRKNLKRYMLLLLVPILEMVIYDPVAYKKIYLLLIAGDPPLLSFHQFDTVIKVVYDVTRFVNIGYLLGAVALLVNYLNHRTHIPFVRNYTAFVLLGFIPVITLFLLTFFWAPKELMAVSALADYVSFNVVDLSEKDWLFLILRYFGFIAFPIIIYATWKLSAVEAYYRKQESHITKSINIAHLGARVFSHALKNQLISIQGEAEYLQSKLQGQEDLLESAQTILSTCDQVIERLNELYDRFKSIDVDLRPAGLITPVSEAVQSFQRTLPPRIAFDYAFPEVNPAVFLDYKHLKEAITVILNNALDAIGQGEGSITVRITNHDNWSVIAIADTGVGMTPEQQKHVFEPFYTTKSSSRNWGIGLSYVHKIILAHHGKIFVESAPGQGSTFTIILPVIV